MNQRMIKTLLSENDTLKELISGNIAFAILTEAVLLIFFPNRLYNFVGLFVGALCGIGMAIHMAYCLEISLTLDEKGATAHVRKMTVLRYVCVCLVLVLFGVFRIGNPLTFIFGVMGLKIGAYLQPITHKVFLKFKKDEKSIDKGGE